MGNFIDAIGAGKTAFWNELTDHEADAGITASDKLIQSWYDIYRGRPSWQDYTFIGVKGRKQARQRKIINAGKFVCQELCSLIWTERPQIKAPNGIINFLNDNKFFKNSEEYSEYGAALGGYVYKLYADDNGLHVDYIKADRFIPRTWNSGTITEADFISDFVYKNKIYKMVEEHRQPEIGIITVTKKLYYPDGGQMRPVKAVSIGLSEEPVIINSPVPLFAYVRYPVANNLQPDTPLGISMYANAPDTLETLDIAFDNLQHEIETSRRKIIIPAEMVESYFDPAIGKDKLRYNPDEETYVAFNDADAKNMVPLPIDFSLRIADITASIQTTLNILSIQVGFSAGYLTFDAAAQAVTATQVISEQSKTFKTKVKYENAIDDGIRTLITAVQSIGSMYGMKDISGTFDIQWNDNIIEDRNSKTDYWLKRYQSKTCTLEDVLVHVDDLTEGDAAKKVIEINKQNATIPSLSDIMGGSADDGA